MPRSNARVLLSRLAGESPPTVDTGRDNLPDEARPYVAIITEASEAAESLETAADFVEDVGLTTLGRAVERAEDDLSRHADEGRTTLEAYREFQDAAGDPLPPRTP